MGREDNENPTKTCCLCWCCLQICTLSPLCQLKRVIWRTYSSPAYFSAVFGVSRPLKVPMLTFTDLGYSSSKDKKSSEPIADQTSLKEADSKTFQALQTNNNTSKRPEGREIVSVQVPVNTYTMATTMRMPATPTLKSPSANGFGNVSPSASYHGMGSSGYSAGRVNGTNGSSPSNNRQRPTFGRAASRVSSVNTSQVIQRRSHSHHFGSGSYKLSLVSETSSSLKRKSMSELGAGVSQSVSSTTFIQFIEWIRSERLATLPHKGSRWDKVLIRAQHFAEQLNGFDAAIRAFAVDSSTAAEIGYGHAKLLLEVSSYAPSVPANPEDKLAIVHIGSSSNKYHLVGP